ncbi:MAG: hypothetical protein PHH11_13750 [Methylomonas sp.]|nr:hypothetical protein [Methylomonas sp.]
MDKLKGIFTGKHTSNEVNFSELIILATLGKKLESDASEKNNLCVVPDCVFSADVQESTDISYDKFKTKLKEGADNSAPLTEEQIKAAFELLKNGRAERDVKDTIVELLKSIPQFPCQVLNDIPNIFRSPTDFPNLPGFDVVAKTAISIIRPDKFNPEQNRVFRLAILAYARMNGVNIEEKNLIDLCDFLETGTQSDFTKLIDNGLYTIKEQYGVNDIEIAAKKLHSISQECMNRAK